MSDLLIQQASRHGVYVQRVAGHLANLFDPYLARLVRELKLIMLDAPEETRSIRRINQIVNEWRKASVAIYGEYNDDILFAELEEFSELESEWEVKSLKSVVKEPPTPIVAPAPAQVWAGVTSTPIVFPDSRGVKLLEPFVKDWEAGQIKRVGDIIRTGYITGRSTNQIVKDIVDSNIGVLGDKTKGGTRASIKTMVRTSTNHTSNIARQKTRENNKDITIGFEIISTLDLKTSNICKHHDRGMVLDEGLIIWADGERIRTNAKPMPAFHPNCRTSTVSILHPDFDVEIPGATRASKGATGGKQVDTDLTYFSWLKQQGNQGKKGREFVHDVLGEERGNLLIDGGLTAKKFAQLTIDEVFQPIPLSELRKKDSLSLAFDRID